ncbi:MAG: hypothetical protein DRO07_00625, partial [Candidatus Iainarchaeum archaeon]
IRALSEKIKRLEKKAKTMPKEIKKLLKTQAMEKRKIVKLEKALKNTKKDIRKLKEMQRNIEKMGIDLQKQTKRLEVILKEAEAAINITAETSAKRSYEKELNAYLAADLVRLYFEEIARAGFKKTLTLSEIINAYKFTLEKLEGSTVLTKTEQEEIASELKEIKKAIEKPEVAPIETKGYSYTNKKGQVYYLHKKGKLYYFSRDPLGAISLPAGYYVKENEQTGLPILKKK